MLFLIFLFLFIDFREKEEGGERERAREKETSICCSTYLFMLSLIHCLILICALTGNQTCNLGLLG